MTTRRFLATTNPEEPPPGSIVMTNGITGTAWQRFFTDGIWHSTTGQTRSWDLLQKSGSMPLLLVHEAPAEEEPTYRIVRFYRDDTPSAVQETGLTLVEAQEHCKRDDSHGEGWFDGYEQEA